MKATFSCIAVILIVSVGCSRNNFSFSNGATISKENFIDCFEPNLQADGRELWCETSAVFYDGTNLFLANDKDMPGAAASVFFLPYSQAGFQGSKPTYLLQPLLKASQKFEDFATTPDRKHALLTTGFDRTKENSNEWDSYNALIYWKTTANPQDINPKIAHLQVGEKFSISLRTALSRALSSTEFPNGVPYFKIEGFAATSDKLYFGVREEGKKYDDFKYKVKVITAPYQFIKDSLAITDNFEILADIDLNTLNPTLPKGLALSSIEYDASRNIFWILTSLESSTQLNCAYLWWATEADLKMGKMNLVNEKATNQPLKFTHKAEDITVMGKNQLFIIHDDDRNKTKIGDKTRTPNQAAYSIVTF